MRVLVLLLLFCSFLFELSAVAQEPHKDLSVLYPADLATRVRANVAANPWAAHVRDGVVEAAAFWKNMNDDDLWKLMFGAILERSWMVWSNGYSPITGKPVSMYTWAPDAQHHPWKLQDPTSGEWFPKNDFKAFYDSGLDEHGIFDAKRANRTLLFNTEHPDANDPKHMFGVDDGTGYVNEKGEKWRFIAAYLIYGQWKQLIVSGVRMLSSAYLLTGDQVYAHKAGLMLDRIADVYPDFDFGKQGVMYEGPPSAGYVSTWHDACEETRELVMSYDMIFDGIKSDPDLVTFLSKKGTDYALPNPKVSFADIQKNIEGGILRHCLSHPERIYSNYPRTEICKAVTTAVLQDPDDAFWAVVDPMLDKATKVDGLTGEKGLTGYTAFTISGLASFLSEFSKADPAFLARVLEKYPRIHDTYRFHIDTQCLQRYYPLTGDCGSYAAVTDAYPTIAFIKPGDNPSGWPAWTLLAPSNFRFLWSLYKATGDAAFVQVLFHANGDRVDGLPYDLYTNDADQFQKDVAEVIRREGTITQLPSVNKQQWHLAILRSGQSANARALWLDYDSGGGHGHMDGMNLGLFAYGLDLMPEMGYPPVQYGGWGSPRAKWYHATAAHNTVVVDGKDQQAAEGETQLWIDGDSIHAIRASGPSMAGVERYERTAVLIDVDAVHFYVVDVFRVRGGHDHTKFQQGHFGELTTSGLNLAPAEDFGHDTQMRNFKMDSAAQPGWKAEWHADDHYKLLPDSTKVGLHYWDFTHDASAGTAEGWISVGGFNDTNEVWIPRLVVRRHNNESDAPLVSTFVSVMEPWRESGVVQSVKRIEAKAGDGSVLPDTEVVLEITLRDGAKDSILLRDPERTSAQAETSFGEPSIKSDAELVWVRVSKDGHVERGSIGKGTECSTGDFKIRSATPTNFFECSAK